MSGPGTHMSCRTLFISDLHLGSRTCKASVLASFLAQHRPETIILVGDAFDFWSIGRRAFWTPAHSEVVRLLCGHFGARRRIVLVPGNHDENLDVHAGLLLEGLEIRHELVHTTLAGERLLVVHGDEHDVVMQRAGRLAHAADWWKEQMGALGGKRRRATGIGRPTGTRAAQTWERLRRRLACVDRFEHMLAAEAERRGFDGVVCGHIHVAADRRIGGVRYLNCGDWVRSCTALIEDWSGRLRLVHWPEHEHLPALPPRERVVAGRMREHADA